MGFPHRAENFQTAKIRLNRLTAKLSGIAPVKQLGELAINTTSLMAARQKQFKASAASPASEQDPAQGPLKADS